MATAPEVSPCISLIVRVDLGPHGRLGPGKILLLERIAETGSISAAARTMNMSYRQAWDLVDQLNRAFDDPVVTSQTGGKSGGGAALTDFGRNLIELYRDLVERARQAAEPNVSAMQVKLRPASEAEGV